MNAYLLFLVSAVHCSVSELRTKFELKKAPNYEPNQDLGHVRTDDRGTVKNFWHNVIMEKRERELRDRELRNPIERSDRQREYEEQIKEWKEWEKTNAANNHHRKQLRISRSPTSIDRHVFTPEGGSEVGSDDVLIEEEPSSLTDTIEQIPSEKEAEIQDQTDDIVIPSHQSDPVSEEIEMEHDIPAFQDSMLPTFGTFARGVLGDYYDYLDPNIMADYVNRHKFGEYINPYAWIA